MSKPKIAIITRMAFADPITVNQGMRFEEMLTMINSQTYKDFSLFILCDSVRDFVGSEDNKKTIAKFTARLPNAYDYNPARFQWDIEVRLDYDDMVAPSFVEDIVKQYNKCQEDNFIISYQPLVHDTETGDMYTHTSKYSADCPSMCMALCQKGKKERGVYDRPHNLMYNETKWTVIVRPEGFYYLQVHGENALSKLPPKKNKL